MTWRFEPEHRQEWGRGQVEAWEEAKMKYQADTLPAMIRLCSEDPDGLKGINQEKVRKVAQRRYPVFKPYREQMENRYQWLVAAVPGEAWAKKRPLGSDLRFHSNDLPPCK